MSILNEYQKSIKRQQITKAFDKKAKALILTSILTFLNNKTKKLAEFKLNATMLADIKKSKSVDEADDKIVKKYKVVQALKVSSNDKNKKQIVRNTEYEACRNRVYEHLKLNDYLTSARQAKMKKLVNAKAKKVKAQRKVKAKKSRKVDTHTLLDKCSSAS